MLPEALAYITRLDLSKIGTERLQQLVDSLQSATLRRRSISSSGAAAPKLQELVLADCNLTDWHQVFALVSVLGSASLARLDLSNNDGLLDGADRAVAHIPAHLFPSKAVIVLSESMFPSVPMRRATLPDQQLDCAAAPTLLWNFSELSSSLSSATISVCSSPTSCLTCDKVCLFKLYFLLLPMYQVLSCCFSSFPPFFFTLSGLLSCSLSLMFFSFSCRASTWSG